MSLPTPEQLAQLAKLKAEFKAKAEIENRKAKAIANAERLSGKPVVLPTDKKASGGQVSQDVMRLAIGGGPDQSPFYSAADKAAQELKRGKGTGAEFLTELTKTKIGRAHV